MTSGPSRPDEVVFFLDDPAPLEGLERLDPETDWREFVRGERVWILQTYLRLRQADYPVRLADEPPSTGLVVFHAKQRRALRRAFVRGSQRAPRSLLVGVRADNHQPLIADFEILQNGRWVSPNRFSVPHWPQSALRPRDAARGTRIERVGFKGFNQSLAAPFRDPAWVEALQRRQLTWVQDAVNFSGRSTNSNELEWNDYTSIDLLLAVRPPDRNLWTSKPATKLINAWRAGVPALLGAEWAYRELRHSELDYLEVTGLTDALDAIERLRADPALYHAMIRNGQRRAETFTVAAITARWAEILYESVPARVELAGRGPLHHLPLGVRSAARRVQRWLQGRPSH